ncbi:MAG: efflux RND transporter periplasmic adaptor subunit [Thermoflexales bacterium]|nr:efflux RND transporter periplasmic adaptor subunit [Thermoflexales bacterium]
MNKKRWLIVVAAVLLAGLGYVGYELTLGIPTRQALAQAPVGETASVERGTLRVTVDASGSLAPNDEVALAFLAGGRVTEVAVKVGDTVQVGDVLARLDDADAREAVANAETQVRQAEINLASARVEAEAGLKQANLASAQAAYDESSTLAAHTGDQLTSKRVNLKQAQDRLVNAQEDYTNTWDPARDWELYTPMQDRLENERETTEQALKDAQDNLQVAQADYNLALAGVSKREVQDAQANVLKAQVALETAPLDREGLELALSQAQLSLTSAQRALEKTVLTAPAGGTVTTLNLHTGEIANTGQTAIVLSDLATLVVEIKLDETDIARLSAGQKVVVTLDAFADVELAGQVTEIAPVAETQSGVVLYPVEVQLAPTDLPVRAGMTADVEIVTASRENTLIVPLRAVHTEGEQAYIDRLAGDQTERVTVELGMMTDTQVEITGGLAEGDKVIVVAAPSAERSQGFGLFGGMRN